MSPLSPTGVALDRAVLFAFAQFVFGSILTSAGLAMGLYQYLVNKDGEALSQDARAKLFYRIIMLTLLVFGAYTAITAYIHARSIGAGVVPAETIMRGDQAD